MSTVQNYVAKRKGTTSSLQTVPDQTLLPSIADERQNAPAPAYDYLEVRLTIENRPYGNGFQSPAFVMLNALDEKCEDALKRIRAAERSGDIETADSIYCEYKALDDVRQDISYGICLADIERAKTMKGGVQA